MRAQFEAVWPLLQPAAERAGTFDKAYVWDEISSGQSSLIWNDDSALVFKLRPVPDGRLCLYMWLTGGTRSGVVALVRQAEQIGKANGCVLSAANCRPGGAKLLPDYQMTSVSLTKEL